MSITAERIKSLRKQKKLTQNELAEIINASRMAIANYETDRNTPSFAMLSLIADALDTNVPYLQGESNQPMRVTTLDAFFSNSKLPDDIKNLFNSTATENKKVKHTSPVDIKNILFDEHVTPYFDDFVIYDDDKKIISALIIAYLENRD
ncbi:helix-turn-helix domain-containing protein [Leuconostoc gasicomitatum]|uniref:helix-turn-helix domain-containing protein n=1 Tax=Leuconostoc gasicomitatum TaxID=115778 RepID=UPI001CC6D2C2|nr:helix-turn-helix transcriptional regulator [Leuconostoc gasicomitatum]